MLVAGVHQLHPDGARIDVALALPERDAGVPGPPRLVHQAEDKAILLDHVVGGDLGGRIAQTFQGGLAAPHARIMDHHHVRRRGAGVEVGGGRLDQAAVDGRQEFGRSKP